MNHHLLVRTLILLVKQHIPRFSRKNLFAD